jgi:hypothetical protein
MLLILYEYIRLLGGIIGWAVVYGQNIVIKIF